MLNKLLKTNKKNNKEKSRGRSMVEMLGVLAIIGVLSIGGISGYTIAMRKYRANEIVNTLSKFATILYTSTQKQMLDNPDAFSIIDGRIISQGSDFVGVSVYAKNNRSNFLNASIEDVGLAKPKGITYLEPWNFYSKTNSTGGVNVLFNDGKYVPGDYIDFKITFDDKELCKTVHNLLEHNPVSYGEDICGYNEVGLSIKVE